MQLLTMLAIISQDEEHLVYCPAKPLRCVKRAAGKACTLGTLVILAKMGNPSTP